MRTWMRVSFLGPAFTALCGWHQHAPWIATFGWVSGPSRIASAKRARVAWPGTKLPRDARAREGTRLRHHERAASAGTDPSR
eukprot:5664952-Pyramimonas_sp.AAC.1